MIKSALNNQRGFTLIELMVVIAIIAILATVGLVFYSGTQKNARDSRRTQDIEAIATALEAHFVPTSTGTCQNSTYTPGSPSYCEVQSSWFAGGAVPTDPKGGTWKYCIAGNDTGAAVADMTPSTDGSCPSGWTAITAGATDTPFNAWTVCATSETNSTKPICHSSSQQ